MKKKINSRRKGHNFEREVVKLFKPFFPLARRGQQGMGAVEPDVVNTSFWIECKCGNKVDIHAAYAQAKQDAMVLDGNHGPCIVISKQTKMKLPSEISPVLVTMSWEDWKQWVWEND